jgi:hypothetical protein
MNCSDVTNNKLIIYTLHLIVYDDNMKKNEMDRTCNTHGGKESIRNVGRKPQSKRTCGGHMRRWQSVIEMDVRIIGMRVLTGFNWPRIGTSERFF